MSGYTNYEINKKLEQLKISLQEEKREELVSFFNEKFEENSNKTTKYVILAFIAGGILTILTNLNLSREERYELESEIESCEEELFDSEEKYQELELEYDDFRYEVEQYSCFSYYN